MPLIVQGPVPPRWQQREERLARLRRGSESDAGVRLALINNMPDAALEDTELQFFELLDAASGSVPVSLRLYSMTGVPRSEQGQRRLNEFYFALDDLWDRPVDGVIVTGTEPRQPDLRNEPYWPLLTRIFDWAASNTTSAILSCLAAHASALHCEGIGRQPLASKKFGVFESVKSGEHSLLREATDRLRFPHSRWNEVREDDLVAAGYEVLTRSVEAGVDLFVKQRQRSLFVHFQGHPEYSAQTLAKEYRRDVRRYLALERSAYPDVPNGYFNESITQALAEFRSLAEAERREDTMGAFPEKMMQGLQNTWSASATGVYRNWLEYLVAGRVARVTAASLTGVSHVTPRKQSVGI